MLKYHQVVSRVNLKLKFQKVNYLPESYDVGRLQDKNLRETFQEQLNAILENSRFDNVEDAWASFRKSISEVGDVFLREKIQDQSQEYQ